MFIIIKVGIKLKHQKDYFIIINKIIIIMVNSLT